MTPPRLALLGPLALLAAASAQERPEVVARYLEDGEPALVSFDDLAQELGARFAGTERGHAALEFLVSLELIRRAAEARGAMPTAADTRAWIGDLERRLQDAGMDLDQLMARKGMTRSEFREFAALQLAQERMVRAALELEPEEEVGPEMLRLWLQEARAEQGVETDPEELPGGIVAEIGGGPVTELELGRVIARTTDVDEQRRYVRQIVLKRRLHALAQERGIEVTRERMEREVEARRREAEANPAFQGVTFDELLQAQGTSVEELAHSTTLRAQVEEQELVARMLPDEEIERRLTEDRAAVLRRVGPRRRLGIVMLRAPDAEARAAATARAGEVRERITQGMSFAEAARTWSEDPYTKVSGGDAGWQYREGSRLPEPVMEWAFDAEARQLSQPIPSDDAVWLVRVAEIEPMPNEATLAYRMREAFARELRARLLEEASIRFVDGD